MREIQLRSVRLPPGTELEPVMDLSEEFPTIRFERTGAIADGDSVIDLDAWSRSPTFAPFDEHMDQATTGRLVLEGAPDDARRAAEVVTRYQRWIDRRTESSRTRLFDDVLATHRRLRAETKTSETAETEQSLDTWQWLLRLTPNASLPLQLAAVYSDIHRDRAFEAMVDTGIEPIIAGRARDLMKSHDPQRFGDRDAALLDDAAGLSFFSLGSAGYLDFYGPSETRRMIGSKLARIGRKARFLMSTVRLRPDVDELFTAVVRA
jgi:hypothetical protein